MSHYRVTVESLSSHFQVTVKSLSSRCQVTVKSRELDTTWRAAVVVTCLSDIRSVGRSMDRFGFAGAGWGVRLTGPIPCCWWSWSSSSSSLLFVVFLWIFILFRDCFRSQRLQQRSRVFIRGSSRGQPRASINASRHRPPHTERAEAKPRPCGGADVRDQRNLFKKKIPPHYRYCGCLVRM